MSQPPSSQSTRAGVRAFATGFALALTVALVIAAFLYFVLDVSSSSLALVAAVGGGAVGMAYAIWLSIKQGDDAAPR